MNNKSIVISVVSLVVGLIAVAVNFVNIQKPQPQTAPLGGTSNVVNVSPTFTDGIELGTLPVKENWVGGKIAAKTASAFWKNTTGATTTVDLAEVSTDGIASSSYKIYVYATSTSPQLFSNITAPVAFAAANFGSLLINGKVIATSSVATTTNSGDANVPQAGSHYLVGPNQYIDVLLFQTGAAVCNGTVTALCETATSSNRGFNLNWRLHYHN